MALGIRLEAIAFRFTILVALMLAVFAGCFARVAVNNSNDASARLKRADSTIAALEAACSGNPKCDRTKQADLWEQVRFTPSYIKQSDETAAWAMTFAVLLPLAAFGAFYVTRWLFTGRFTPLWPIRKATRARG